MIMHKLYDLIHAGDANGAAEWLDRNPDDMNAWIGEGYAPLHVACMFGHEQIVRMLLDRRALVNLNADNPSRATPLHVAVMFRDDVTADAIVRVLLENGAELNSAQQLGQTPLHHAVARGSLRLVRTLIESGADPFFKDEKNRTPADLAKELPSDMPTAEAIRATLKEAFSLPLES